jgi:nucleotide-binding universal stress UspA family protein
MKPRDPEPRDPILATFSPSKSGDEPVEFGLAASRITGAPLVIVTVPAGGPVVDEFAVEGDVEQLRLGLERRGLAADIRVSAERTAGSGVTKAMEELNPQMVVLGATHRGAVGAALLGTTVEHVIHAAACPVAVVPQGYQRPREGVQVIGAAYLPTPEGHEALRAVAALARIGSVRLRAIRVLDPDHAAEQSGGLPAGQHRDTSPDEADQAYGRLRGEAELRGAVAQVATDVDAEVAILFNDPADGLVAASRHVGLLVMGSRAQGPRRAVILGSVSRELARHSACPVVIIPRGAARQRRI